MRYGRGVNAQALISATAILAAVVTAGCEDGEGVTVQRAFTATVAISAGTVQFDTLLPIEILGERRDDVVLNANLTLTASSATVAQRALDAWTLTTATEGGVAAFVIGPAEMGLIGGTATVRVPNDVVLRVLQRNGTVGIAEMRERVEVQSVGPVLVLNAETDVIVRAENGDVRVDTPLRGATAIDVDVAQGNVQVDLPAALNANVEAASTQGINSSHPDLPTRPGGVPYNQTVGRGVGSVVATTRSGAVIFTVRNN